MNETSEPEAPRDYSKAPPLEHDALAVLLGLIAPYKATLRAVERATVLRRRMES